MKKLIFAAFAAAACVGIAGCGSTQSNTSESTTATETKEYTTVATTTTAVLTTTTTEAPTTTTTAESKESYMSKCKEYTFEEIARNPEKHKGEYAKLIGEVIQVLEENGAYTLRVNITKGEYDIWTDTIMVYYVGDADNNRILEDDMVTMYGQLGGMYTYTTIMGGENTVPLLYAEYIDIN